MIRKLPYQIYHVDLVAPPTDDAHNFYGAEGDIVLIEIEPQSDVELRYTRQTDGAAVVAPVRLDVVAEHWGLVTSLTTCTVYDSYIAYAEGRTAAATGVDYFVIDWGDGTTTNFGYSSVPAGGNSHTYATAGTYTITVSVVYHVEQEWPDASRLTKSLDVTVS